MKHLANAVILCLFISCSSIKQQRVVEEQVAREAADYVSLADNYSMNNKNKDALKRYDKAAALFLSKLNYESYALIKLKMANVHTEMKSFEKTSQLIDQVIFCQKEFHLDLDYEILSARVKLKLAQGNTQQAAQGLSRLMSHYDKDLEKRSYYQAMALKHTRKNDGGLIANLDLAYKTLWASYENGSIKNVNVLIYVGKVLLDYSGNKNNILLSLEQVARDLELKSLSYDLLFYRKGNATSQKQEMYGLLIEDLLKE